MKWPEQQHFDLDPNQEKGDIRTFKVKLDFNFSFF